MCGHIAMYYSEVGPDPCAFWTFDLSIFGQPPPIIDDKPSTTGDVCHRTVEGVSNSKLKRLYEQHGQYAAHRMCVGGALEPFTPERAAALKAEHYD